MVEDTRQDAHSDSRYEALKELASRLRQLRAQQRFSVTVLAARAVLGRTTVSKALNGASLPTEETIIALATALRTDHDPLLELRRQAQLPVSKTSHVGDTSSGHSRRLGSADTAFEHRYRQYVASKHEKLSVIGLDLARPDRSCWPLDAAYLSLDLAVTNPGRLSVRGIEELERSGTGIRAEQALASHQRILVRGHAGSGKTTLLQWLAVGAARQSLPTELAHLNNHFPFVLPLRTLARTGNFPIPDRYLDAINCPLIGAQPSGWADKVMDSGRGLLLIDGVDEVAQEQRPRTREWLLELLAAYPRNYFAVTTRPTAVPDGWLAESGFGELSVQPMSNRDVSVFIGRWHEAAKSGAASDEECTQLASLEEKLKDTVRSQHGLAQMTTTPLLCALVCALHRDRHGHLPHGRMELYAAALTMLLHRRDRERNIQPEGLRLSERQSTRLLQRLAYWMVDNGQAEISRADALYHMGEALPAMPDVAEQGGPLPVLDYLVERSGVLRTPDDDTIDFVHRTFQDYLAAKAAIDKRNMGALVKHAHDDRWEDVIRMAVAHASPDDAQKLMQRLIARGDRNTANVRLRTRLYLLAAACLDYATELNPAIRMEVHDRTAALLPPRSIHEAHTLAGAGQVILDLLPGPDELQDDEAEAVVYTAGLIGGDAAMSLLKKYRTNSQGLVPWYLQMHWNQFDISEYAREVLAHIQGLPILSLQSSEQLAELPNIPIPSHVSFNGEFTVGEIGSLLGKAQIKSLGIHNNATLDNLEPLAQHKALDELTLNNCPNANDLSPFGDSTISAISILIDAWSSVIGMESLTKLRKLEISAPLPYSDLSELPVHADLTSLELGYRTCINTSLRGITRWPSLTKLALYVHDEVEGLEEIPALGNLKTLELYGWGSDRIITNLPHMPQVEELLLNDWIDTDWVKIRDKLPGLRDLRIFSSFRRVDITPLRDVSGIVITINNASEVHGSEYFPPHTLNIHPRPRS